MRTTPFTTSRLLGVLLAVLSGVAIGTGLDWVTKALRLYQSPNYLTYSLGFTALCILLAGVGAWFLRTWWALLVTPFSFFVGCMLGAVIDIFMPGNAFDSGYLGLGVAIFIFYLLPVVLVALIAAVISKLVVMQGG
jgi:hypothetical protein